MEDRKKAWFYRFTIGTLLFVTFLIAGLLSGYKAGFRRGANARAKASFVQTYQVGDLLGSNQDVDGLFDLITTTVGPDSWDDVGGDGTIQYSPTYQTLIINQRGALHDQIRDLLGQLRASDR